MWQSEVRIDLDAIRDNVALMRAGTTAEVMAVVKGDGYGHGMLPSARAALAWLHSPGLALHEGVAAGIDLSASTLGLVGELVTAARRAERQARVHLKLDTGLSRGGATQAHWPAVLEAAAKAQADGDIDVVGVWSHFISSDVPGDPTIDHQLAAFADGLAVAERYGVSPRYRHIANS